MKWTFRGEKERERISGESDGGLRRDERQQLRPQRTRGHLGQRDQGETTETADTHILTRAYALLPANSPEPRKRRASPLAETKRKQAQDVRPPSPRASKNNKISCQSEGSKYIPRRLLHTRVQQPHAPLPPGLEAAEASPQRPPMPAHSGLQIRRHKEPVPRPGGGPGRPDKVPPSPTAAANASAPAASISASCPVAVHRRTGGGHHHPAVPCTAAGGGAAHAARHGREIPTAFGGGRLAVESISGARLGGVRLAWKAAPFRARSGKETDKCRG